MRDRLEMARFIGDLLAGKPRKEMARLAARAKVHEQTIRRIRDGDESVGERTLDDVAEKLGMPPEADTVADLVRRVDALEDWQRRVAGRLGAPPAAVVPLRREPEPDEGDDMVEVRYVADLAAGPPLSADRQSAVESVPRRLVPRGVSGYEIHRVRGTSMHLAGIGDGALVLCRNVRGTKNYRNGDIVCVQVEGSDSAAGTIKRFKRTHDGRREFVSESDVPEDQIAPIAVDECMIVGRVVARKEGERWVEVPRGSRR